MSLSDFKVILVIDTFIVAAALVFGPWLVRAVIWWDHVYVVYVRWVLR